MLIENTLFGEVDKVADSLELIRQHEPADGYYVAFSGGKDSTVVYDLVKRAGVKHDVHCSLTTLEPPEVIDFIHSNFDDVIFHTPPMDAWQLIRKHLIPYTRRIRYCARELKTQNGKGRLIVTGVRRSESVARRKRQARETRYGDEFLNPIIDWTESDVWQYIHERGLPYCHLYDQGFRRIGCLLCPFQTKAERELHIQRYPEIAAKFKLTFQEVVDERRRRGKPCTFESGEDLWNWWINPRR